MTHIITVLCTRQGDCVEVCPVDCIVPGPKDDPDWAKYFYIDPDTCIDCGACIPECPYEAIFVEDEVPTDYAAKGGEYLNKPAGTAGFDTAYEGENAQGETVQLKHTRVLEAGEAVDLTPDIQPNYDYFTDGPGYSALDE